MSRVALWLPLVGSTLILMFALRGESAVFPSRHKAAPRSEGDKLFIQCSTARTLLLQNRGKEALILLKSHASLPLSLALETPLSNDVTPGTRIIQLGKDLIKEAEKAQARGQLATTRAYLAECRTLSYRVRCATPSTNEHDEEMHFKVAYAINQMTTRAEALLLPH
jgi:hypothetical protein